MTTAKTLLTAEEFDNYPFEEDKRSALTEADVLVSAPLPGFALPLAELFA